MNPEADCLDDDGLEFLKNFGLIDNQAEPAPHLESPLAARSSIISTCIVDSFFRPPRDCPPWPARLRLQPRPPPDLRNVRRFRRPIFHSVRS